MIKVIDERIRRALSGIRRTFRGVITLVKAAGAVQIVQAEGLSGELVQDIELFQHYGYTSNPPQGSMAIILPIGGKTSHGIVIATEHGTYRLKNLAPGESALYDDQGQKIHITRSGIVIDGAGKPINIQNTPHVIADTPKFTFTHDVEILGKLDVTQDITGAAKITGLALYSVGDITAFRNSPSQILVSGMRTVYDGHIHTDSMFGATTVPNALM
jgi:phage baseplate assembly protein V